MASVWSILHWMKAPSHRLILAEKEAGVRLAQEGLRTIEALNGQMPTAEYERQHRAFSNAFAGCVPTPQV